MWLVDSVCVSTENPSLYVFYIRDHNYFAGNIDFAIERREFFMRLVCTLHPGTVMRLRGRKTGYLVSSPRAQSWKSGSFDGTRKLGLWD